MIEAGFIEDDLGVEQPVAALRAISHDPTLRHQVLMRDGRRLTGVQLQMEYLDLAKKFVQDTEVDAVTADVLERWESVLDRLVDDPMSCAREIDWVTKLQILEGYRSRDGLEWDSHTLQLVDLQFHDVRPDKGLYNRMAAGGRVERLLGEDEVTRAMTSPPEDTRAYFRGRCLDKYAAQVAAASWDSVIFDIGRESLQRVPTLEPTRGTKAHVGALLDRCETAEQLVDALAG
jgi:proteasome accessory factor A